MTHDFTQPVRRALRSPCKTNLLDIHRPIPPGSRVERCRRIQNLLRSSEVNMGSLAKLLGVSWSTIARDIAWLRHLGMQITYDPRRYVFAKPSAINS